MNMRNMPGIASPSSVTACRAVRTCAFLLVGLLALGAEDESNTGDDPHVAPTPPVTLDALSTQTAAVIGRDATSARGELEGLMRSLRERIDSAIVLAPHEEDMPGAGPTVPATGDPWRLWVFWSMDVAECAGLASALVTVRGSGLVVIHPVHLSSLRHWEEWLFRQNDHREQLLRSAQHGDQLACTALSRQWLSEVDELRSLSANFYHAGILAMSDTRSARLLHVESVPSFRLISPFNTVHALDGFGPDFPLLDWIKRCMTWESAHTR
jgi:hypothetical protein